VFYETGMMTSAALALGVSAVIPSAARADNGRDRHDGDRYHNRNDRYDRHDDRGRFGRDDRRYDERYRDFDSDVSLRDVPHDVCRTIDQVRHDQRITAVQYVRRDGKLFYRFQLDGPGRREDLSVRVAPADGC